MVFFSPLFPPFDGAQLYHGHLAGRANYQSVGISLCFTVRNRRGGNKFAGKIWDPGIKDRALLSSSLARLEGPFVRFLFFLPPEPSTCSPPSPPSLVVATLVCFGLQCVLLSSVGPPQSDSHGSVQWTTCEGQPGMILGRIT